MSVKQRGKISSALSAHKQGHRVSCQRAQVSVLSAKELQQKEAILHNRKLQGTSNYYNNNKDECAKLLFKTLCTRLLLLLCKSVQNST